MRAAFGRSRATPSGASGSVVILSSRLVADTADHAREGNRGGTGLRAPLSHRHDSRFDHLEVTEERGDLVERPGNRGRARALRQLDQPPDLLQLFAFDAGF